MKKTVILLAMMAFAGSAAAQELPVNENDWNNLSDADKQAIEQIMQETFKNEALEIMPTPDAPAAAAPEAAAEAFRPFGGLFCKPLCDIAYTAATIACQRLPPPAVPVCMQIAAAARDACYARCDAN